MASVRVQCNCDKRDRIAPASHRKCCFGRHELSQRPTSPLGYHGEDATCEACREQTSNTKQKAREELLFVLCHNQKVSHNGHVDFSCPSYHECPFSLSDRHRHRVVVKSHLSKRTPRLHLMYNVVDYLSHGGGARLLATPMS